MPDKQQPIVVASAMEQAIAALASSANPELAELILFLSKHPELIPDVRDGVTSTLNPESTMQDAEIIRELSRLRSVLDRTKGTDMGGQGYLEPGNINISTNLRLAELRKLGEHPAMQVVVANKTNKLLEYDNLIVHAVGAITIGTGQRLNMQYRNNEGGSQCVLIIFLS